ncbi:hypothetical protein MKW94_030240 [Papaver nudicaule]|uniref:RRM domain-containing protein n=1 Tax=Papaver nudicaule TaxID=74823 RepID=A0AA41VQ93_PAPNU|nr:hypothetical protein [Papaver nudicaule]
MDSSFQRKVFVGGLPWAATEETVTDYFSKFGDVVETTIVRDKNTGNIKGFGFILFSESSSVDKALEEENHSILGRAVDVKRALPRSEQQHDHSHQNQGNNWNNSISVSNGDVHNNGWFKTKKIFVGGLSTITKEELSSFFGKFGNITDVVVMYDKLTQRARGFGFITFESEEAVDRVMQMNHYEVMKDISVEVKRAIPRDVNNHSSNGFGTHNVSGYPYDSNATVSSNYAGNYPSGYPGAYMPFYPPAGANYMYNGYGYYPAYGMMPADPFGDRLYAGVGINQNGSIGAAVNDGQNGGNDE